MSALYLLALLTLLTPLVVLYATGRFALENLPTAAGTMAAGTLIVLLTVWGVSSYVPKNTQTINGFITTKEIQRFTCEMNTGNPCENGYDCNCHMVAYDCSTTDSKGNRQSQTCWRQECDRCYRYPWEQNFYLASSLQGDRAYKISRVDEQGLRSPPRWLAVRHGDPVCITTSYEDYISDAANSLFAQDGEAEQKYKAKLPAYPQRIYDYYKMDRLVTVGKVKLDLRKWNEEIGLALVQMGNRKQANLIVVVAEGVQMDFANAVRRSWRGFKKNDIVVFVGVDATGKYQWVRAMSWSKTSLVNIQIETEVREAFENAPLEPVRFMSLVRTATLASFQRRPMEEFKYLRAEASLSTGQVVFIWFIVLFATIGGAMLTIHLTEGVSTFRDMDFNHFRSLDQFRQIRNRGFSASTARIYRGRQR